MGKNKKKQIKIRGTELTVWCPGWKTYPTEMHPWYIVTAPFYLNEKGKRVAYPPSWNDDGHTDNFMGEGVSYPTAEEAIKVLNWIRERKPEALVHWYPEEQK